MYAAIPNTALVDHCSMTHNIHRFAFHDCSREAVDAFIEQIRVNAQHLPDKHGVGRMLLVFSEKGLPSLVYLFRNIKALTSEIALPHEVYLAIVHHPSFMAATLKTFIDMLPSSNLRHLRAFSIADYDSAVSWLAQDAAP